jgi:hypothetical protein
VVEIEQRALRALQECALSAAKLAIETLAGIPNQPR